MSRPPLAALLGGLALILGCGDSRVSTLTPPPTDLPLTVDQAARFQGLRIVFGHQSVGGNLVDGLSRLATAGEPVPLSIQRTLQVEGASPGVLAHEWIGENGAPASKLAAFGAALDGPARGANVGIVKFCYSDFGPETDPEGLFQEYARQVREWQSLHPGITFVHITAPAVRPEGTVSRWVRTLRGRMTMRERATKVARYNARLREAYAGREPVFDLAAHEAAGPSGRATGFRAGGTEVPLLHPAFTDDGEHLNGPGRVAVARKFLRFLADSVSAAVVR